jgi:putative OPT family oligopeptide transporter
MQIGDIFGIIVASPILFFVLMLLDRAYHFGSAQLPAPQAGLMAMLSQGIVGGNMAWPLVVVGILMGVALIMVQVRSPMLFSVGMYLPVETTFAIFIGGIIRWITDKMRDRRNLNDAQKARVENAGILVASGLIAGEALCGLLIAGICRGTPDPLVKSPHWIGMIIAAAALIFVMIKVPLANAGRPEEPAPPTAIM